MSGRADASERTLPGLLGRRADRDAYGVLFRDDLGPVTAGEAWTMAGRIAAGFHRLGIAPDDRVAVMLANSREFLFTWFGLGTLGAVEVPVNPLAKGQQLVYVLRHSGARSIVVGSEMLPALAPILAEVPELKFAVVIGAASTPVSVSAVAFDEVLDQRPRFSGPSPIQPSDTTAIMYTSGSTGPAKGVILPHGQHVENGRQAVDVARISADDRLFVCLPLHHNMAQGYGVMPALVSGASFALSRRFDRSTFWSEVAASESTVWPFVGAMLVLLTKDLDQGTMPARLPAHNGHPLRVAFGVPIPAEVHRRFEEGFGLRLIPCYGSTEGTIVTWGTADGDAPVGSCGKVIPNFDVQIQASDGTEVGPGEIGEICIRPRDPFTMFQGYHNDPERARMAVRNLWYHSSDRGRIDADGYLWFEGRTEDVIRRFSEFISASEVEGALLGCPTVDMAAAFGIRDEVAGEELMVAVVPRPGVALSVADVLAWSKKQLPDFSVPRYIDIVESLPMTATGKVEKYVLRARGVSAATHDTRS